MKLENLISTRAEAEHKYLAELILGASLGFALGDHFELGMRIWTNLALAGGGETIAALEPQLSAHLGHLQLLLGGIWPFAGALTDPQFGGVRVALSARL